MRRLLEWLDVSHIVSGTAHVAVGLFCLTAVTGALAISVTKSQATSAPALVAAATIDPDKAGADVVALTITSDAATAASGATAQVMTASQNSRQSGTHSGGIVSAVYHSSDSGLLRFDHENLLDESALLESDAVARPTLQIKLNDLEAERRCLIEGIYYEARGERAVGQLAVAEVVINRVLSGRYPSTICGVVFQGASTGRCQFSFACDGSMKRPRDHMAWRKAQRMAHYMLSGRVRNSLVGAATYYHASYVSPYWAPSMVEVAKIGQHIFYSSDADGLTGPQS